MSKKKKPKRSTNELSPAEAMLALMDRKGALKSKNSQRGAQFIEQLHGKAYGPLKKGAREAIMQGKDVARFMEPEARMQRRMRSQRLKQMSEDQLRQLVRKDSQLSRIMQRIFP